MSQSTRRGLSFFGMITAVMAGLKLKQKWDEQYNPLATDEEGRAFSTPLDPTPPYTDNDGDEANVGLLHNEVRPKHRRKKGCCVCCGLDCSLFWKAFGIVVLGLAIWYSVKLILWAVSDAPTGLELMPAFSSSLGCLAAPHIYNGTKVAMTAEIGPENDHSFDIRGSAIGTFVIAQGSNDQKDVKYEMTVRSGDQSLLKYVDVIYPDYNEDGAIRNSRLVVVTPRTGPEAECMRFDIVMYIPPTLKKLHVISHATTHVQFAAGAVIDLESFYVTLFAMDSRNLILPSQSVRGDYMALELIRGWIVGDVALANSTSITTQRGDGITNVRVHPVASSDPEHPTPLELRTTTGAGRTDIFYIGSKAFKRQIDSVHMSSRNADMYLNYKEAEFSGRIALDSKSFTTTGAQRFTDAPSEENGQKWTHWLGDQEGADRIYVRSRGWSGLYF